MVLQIFAVEYQVNSATYFLVLTTGSNVPTAVCGDGWEAMMSYYKSLSQVVWMQVSVHQTQH